ncbi:Epsin-1, required for endocytosis and actin patch assembly [Phytophthora pseudosyringae]|uniref:Epsin-1, required for endocytosis and actin patch assembly n=1 Tax=Phytophthora pseudosyringae TaxID=221518 RepID=A0A8T1VQI9_9STRA|nr:Epsin-1, required for endocytosis and actin patch assembly [Phytophthora pseudosyringae]
MFLRLARPLRGAASNARRFSKKAPEPTPTPTPRPTKQMVVTELKEVGKLMFGGLAVTTALIASGGFVIETVKTLNPMDPPGFKLQVSGADGQPTDVHVQRRGGGDVTVLLDGGVGETSFDWDKVAADVAEFATVLSVDRPGLGFSKPGALPRTSMQIVGEYKQVLEQLNVTGKLVLVAHGAGGYNMRELAQELEVSAGPAPKCEGLVLVDALQENLRGELEGVSEVVHQSLSDMDSNGEMVLRMSRFGLIRLINVVQHAKSVAKYSPVALPYVEHFSPSPAHREGALRENQAIPETEQRFRDAAAGSAPFEFPCVVLSHGKAGMFDSMKMQAGVTPQMLADLERKWLDAQTKLAHTVSKRSVHVVVNDAGHCIHHEKPEEVTKAVRALVDEIHGDVDEHRGLMSLTKSA